MPGHAGGWALTREDHHIPLICTHRARVVVAAMVIGGALALSACGSATSSSTGTGPAAATTRASTHSQTAVATTTTTITRTATGPGAAVCRAAALKLTFLGMQGATGHGELGFAVRNTSASTCHTFGYPGVKFSSQSGALLPTVTHRSTNDFFGPSPLARITLTPGATASFRLGVTHGNGSSAGCTTAYGVRVYPPNDTATLRVSMPGGASECGSATVSPMRTQTSAYP